LFNSVLCWYSFLILCRHCDKYLNKYASNQSSNERTDRNLFYTMFCAVLSRRSSLNKGGADTTVDTQFPHYKFNSQYGCYSACRPMCILHPNTDEAEIYFKTVKRCEISDPTRRHSDEYKRQNDRVFDYALTYWIIRLPPSPNYKYSVFHCISLFLSFVCNINWCFHSDFVETNN